MTAMTKSHQEMLSMNLVGSLIGGEARRGRFLLARLLLHGLDDLQGPLVRDGVSNDVRAVGVLPRTALAVGDLAAGLAGDPARSPAAPRPPPQGSVALA